MTPGLITDLIFTIINGLISFCIIGSFIGIIFKVIKVVTVNGKGN